MMPPPRSLGHALRESWKALKPVVFIAIFLLGLALIVTSRNLEERAPSRAKLDLHNLAATVTSYETKHGEPPPRDRWSESLGLEGVPKDPWSRPYLYEVGADRLQLRSLGRDGIDGGVGPDADLMISIPLH